MERKIVLLGYGMQGKACAYDLVKYGDFESLSVVDCYDGCLQDIEQLADTRVRGYQVNGEEKDRLRELFEPAALVIEFFPPHFTLPMVELAIDCGCHVITSSYIKNPAYENQPGFAERIAKLNKNAKEKDLIILEEFGMDPGIDLAVGQKVVDSFDEVHALHSYGAGFPELEAASNPLRYKFTWSVIGLIRSHLRPAVYLDNGTPQHIAEDAMFSPENIHLLEIPGLEEQLECFCNGNSMQYTSLFGIQESVKSMGRYICRWPGHGAFWERMARCGFLSGEPIQVGDQQVKPEEFCAALLGGQKQFYYQKGERDIGLIRVDGRGLINGQPKQVVIQSIVHHDADSGFSAMQQTVGFPMAIGSMMILDGKIQKPGMTMPMHIPLDFYFSELEKRGITFDRVENDWDGNCNP
jgi:saccharopine dehydrogenase-like NADP-dependent oxidoreductase